MVRMNLRFNRFYSPDDALGMGGDTATADSDLDTLELLNADEPEEKVEPLDIEEKKIQIHLRRTPK